LFDLTLGLHRDWRINSRLKKVQFVLRRDGSARAANQVSSSKENAAAWCACRLVAKIKNNS
jgi:hypothetical protein